MVISLDREVPHTWQYSQLVVFMAYPGLGNRSIFNPGSSVGNTHTVVRWYTVTTYDLCTTP